MADVQDVDCAFSDDEDVLDIYVGVFVHLELNFTDFHALKAIRFPSRADSVREKYRVKMHFEQTIIPTGGGFTVILRHRLLSGSSSTLFQRAG